MRLGYPQVYIVWEVRSSIVRLDVHRASAPGLRAAAAEVAKTCRNRALFTHPADTDAIKELRSRRSEARPKHAHKCSAETRAERIHE